ncbi:unnamed protein product [Heligmosomoides polygyrus]|uniref:Beta-lactamase domain-containing protein n=1 Tax=Heligmosomoides polygyrus TaxID=6339 RepID=A0A183FZK7_HELPZ|nr:unnamed protein product [Heligmosomoides polygyrus]
MLLRLAAVLCCSSAALVHYQLSDVWKRREREGMHLFPTLSSIVYPEFVGFPHETGTSRVRMSYDEVEEFAANLNGTEVTSVCSYEYLGTTFYVVNTDKSSGDEVEFSLNLTMAELETTTEEMLLRRLKPSNICRGRDGRFQAVWRGSKRYLRHYIVQEGTLDTILREDSKHGRQGYYPASIQVYRAENQTTALVIWEKGYGVRYRIQSGSYLSFMDEEMEHTQMKPCAVAALPGKTLRLPTKYFVVWRSDDFAWKKRVIPRSSLPDPTITNVTELDDAVEKEMRILNVPSLSICIYRGGVRVLSVSYGYSDLRTETRAQCSFVVLSDPQRSSRKRLNGSALLEFYIRSYEPKFQPGRRYLYSNIAYVLLGQIIEQISSRSYESFIQDVVLKPNHIEARMGDVESGKSEVSYYSPDNANPYTYWTPSKLNAAAGWVMRAEEVTRLFLLLEYRKYTTYRMLVQPSAVKWSYGRGLQLGDDGSLYHIGSLAGSEGIGYSRGDLQVAILTNSRGREQGEHTAWMEQLCRRLANRELLP